MSTEEPTPQASLEDFERLVIGLLDGSLTADERERLNELLQSDERARQTYIDLIEIDALLTREFAQPLNLGQVDTPKRRRSILKVAAVALALFVGSLSLFVLLRPDQKEPVAFEEQRAPMAMPPVVANVISTTDAIVLRGVTELVSGAPIRKGDRLYLSQGMVDIAFENGTLLTLSEGSTLIIESDASCRLDKGRLIARMSDESSEFVVRAGTAIFKDLGTEFGVVAYDDVAADLHVFDGKVEAVSTKTTGGTTEPVAVSKGEAIRFAHRSQEAKRIVCSAHDFKDLFAYSHGILALHGQVEYDVSQPQSLKANAYEGKVAKLVREAQGLQLDEPIPLEMAPRQDELMLHPDQRVDSYVLHFDPVGQGPKALQIRGTIIFRGRIVGLIASSEGLATTDRLFSSGSIQFSTEGNGKERRGSMEANDTVSISDDGHSLEFSLDVRNGRDSSEFDQIRILVESPQSSGGDDSFGQFSVDCGDSRARRMHEWKRRFREEFDGQGECHDAAG